MQMQNVIPKSLIRRNCFLAFFLTTLFSISSCKKDKNEAEDKCPSLPPSGHLAYTDGTKTYTYKTSGGGTINVAPNVITIGHDSYPGFKIELWGGVVVDGTDVNSANHENLNGKHIKDRMGSRRTILFPDGAKITIVADGEQGPIISISIYDGAEAHQISGSCHTIVKSTSSSDEALQLDNAEMDGEAGGFEFTQGGLLYVNFYREDSPGNKVMDRVLLGEIFRDKPSVVNDYFDDPRRGDS
jgi:hypothetical protein